MRAGPGSCELRHRQGIPFCTGPVRFVVADEPDSKTGSIQDFQTLVNTVTAIRANSKAARQSASGMKVRSIRGLGTFMGNGGCTDVCIRVAPKRHGADDAE